MKGLCSEYKRIINFFESDSFGAAGFFLCYIDILIDKFSELDKTVFKNASKNAKLKINELKTEYSQFWRTVAPMALLLNPCIPYKKLLSKSEVQKAKIEIIKRINNYEPKNRKKFNENQPVFMEKYFQKNKSEEEETDQTTLDIILKQRNLNHSSEALYHFWYEKIETSDKVLALVAFDILEIVVTSVASERSFSHGRLVINDQRTRISSDNARNQMIIQINKEIAEKALSRTNIIELISKY